MYEVNRMVSIMDIIRRYEQEHKIEQLYVSGNIYGYKKRGKWYESDGTETWEVTPDESV